MISFTTEQVLAMAPDASSVKAGQGLASPGKWVQLGRHERSVWGECQGSGKSPYRTQADLTEPAFNCSCPSRKFPCKHGLGLMLILAAKPDTVKEAEPPPWVAEWIAKRDSSAERKATKEAAQQSDDPEAIKKREADREKRAAKRDDRVREGLSDLQTWLGDLMRHGLAHAKQQPAQYWDGMAARMIDCQAPGAARMLRQIPGLVASGEQWADRLLEQLGSIQLLLQGYRRMEELPPELSQDVRAAIGWTVAEEEVNRQPAVTDRWHIIGHRIEQEEQLRIQRTWLFGEKSSRAALHLSFAAGPQPLDISLPPGFVVEADLAFYPSAFPLRALVRQRRGELTPIAGSAGFESIEEALEAGSDALSSNPWLERIPWSIRDCAPLQIDRIWHLRDKTGGLIPIAASYPHIWPLNAFSGGHPITVHGEWNGREFYPLSASGEGRFIGLGGALAS